MTAPAPVPPGEAERRTRARVAADLRRAAEGRRHYATNAPPDMAAVLEAEAAAYDTAAKIAGGGGRVMRGVLPAAMWDGTEHSTAPLDCRSGPGVTVGLLDGIIACARVVRDRDLAHPAVAEALADLADDEDLAWLLQRGRDREDPPAAPAPPSTDAGTDAGATPVAENLRMSVREMVHDSGLKQVFIAERLGITPKHLSQLLHGSVVMTVDWAVKIADVCMRPLRLNIEPTGWAVDVVTWRETAERSAATVQRARDAFDGTSPGAPNPNLDALIGRALDGRASVQDVADLARVNAELRRRLAQVHAALDPPAETRPAAPGGPGGEVP